MKIYAPNIHLFAFQLYKASNFQANENETNKLWQNADKIAYATLQQDLHLIQHIDIDKEPNSRRVDLLNELDVKDGDYSLPFTGKILTDNLQQLVIKGFTYPFRLSDSCGFWLNLRRPEDDDDGTRTKDIDIHLLSKLNPDNCLILEKSNLLLGQTLLITAWLPGAKDNQNINLTPKEYLEIANKCFTSIFNNKILALNYQGELFGSPIFEYGLFSQLDNYQHVLIWLFTNNTADEQLQQCYQELLDLFFFRTKIVKAFQDSREIYLVLVKSYEEIESFIDNLSQMKESKTLTLKDLKEYKNLLKELPQLGLKYTRLLRNLEEHQNTITLHEYNYLEKLQQIHGITKENLDFFKVFTEKTSSYFQKQIVADLGYFRHSSTLLEQAISSTRGIVEITQAERDRSLEKTIQVLGVGLGAGAIASGVITQQISYINKPLGAISLNNPPHPFYASLFLSMVATLFFTCVAWLWTNRK
ncbi:hypothetical protein F7734_34705 [Scytonema sp. UIC 10036]|uniref:hypothetical protein n=1 Tax=Scytonema sp. UIC 10036 TaxID=2304196 RepID=UPI0012DA838B|nr:hypothetical protein [Scytonema sp. UIC 10036]MUG97208.1 hypothetical protein [Scytonema sp. UIC 10036]